MPPMGVHGKLVLWCTVQSVTKLVLFKQYTDTSFSYVHGKVFYCHAHWKMQPYLFFAVHTSSGCCSDLRQKDKQQIALLSAVTAMLSNTTQHGYWEWVITFCDLYSFYPKQPNKANENGPCRTEISCMLCYAQERWAKLLKYAHLPSQPCFLMNTIHEWLSLGFIQFTTIGLCGFQACALSKIKDKTFFTSLQCNYFSCLSSTKHY